MLTFVCQPTYLVFQSKLRFQVDEWWKCSGQPLDAHDTCYGSANSPDGKGHEEWFGIYSTEKSSTPNAADIFTARSTVSSLKAVWAVNPYQGQVYVPPAPVAPAPKVAQSPSSSSSAPKSAPVPTSGASPVFAPILLASPMGGAVPALNAAPISSSPAAESRAPSSSSNISESVRAAAAVLPLFVCAIVVAVFF